MGLPACTRGIFLVPRPRGSTLLARLNSRTTGRISPCWSWSGSPSSSPLSRASPKTWTQLDPCQAGPPAQAGNKGSCTPGAGGDHQGCHGNRLNNSRQEAGVGSQDHEGTWGWQGPARPLSQGAVQRPPHRAGEGPKDTGQAGLTSRVHGLSKAGLDTHQALSPRGGCGRRLSVRAPSSIQQGLAPRAL